METNKQTRTIPSRDIDGELGRRAHMLMWDYKLSTKSVAASMGIGGDSLGRKLKGERGWAIAEIVSLAAVLDTSVAYLVGEVSDPHGSPTNGAKLPQMD
jgi:hypothetical protein